MNNSFVESDGKSSLEAFYPTVTIEVYFYDSFESKNPSHDLLCQLLVGAVMDLWKVLNDLIHNYREIENIEGNLFTDDLKKFVAHNVLGLSI